MRDMAKSLKEIKEERAQLSKEYRELYDKIDAEKRSVTADEDAKFDELRATIEKLDKEEARASFLEKEEKRKADLDELQRRSDSAGGTAVDVEERNAFIQYLRDPEGMTHEQRSLLASVRAQNTLTDQAGGALVAKSLGNRVIEALKSFGGMLTAVEKISTTKGGIMTFPTVDDTDSEATIVEESGASTKGGVTFGTVSMNAWTYRSKLIPVSYELLQDSEYDIEGLLARLIANSIWRALNKHITIGDGDKKPQGIISCPKGTSAASGALTYDNLVDLRASLDAAYTPGASWVMNGNTEAVLMKLKDAQGRPLWVPALASEQPNTILGSPVIINPHMPDVKAGQISLVFGDLKGYTLREVKGVGVLRLNERLADELAVGFFGYARYDGKITNKSALRHLQHA